MEWTASLDAALKDIVAETESAMTWLADGLDPDAPVTFIPNPGNIGDAAINVACYGFLAGRFAQIEVCGTSQSPSHETVFIGGGGNLVEPLYAGVSGILRRMNERHLVRLFPATVYGYARLIEGMAGRMRMVCRDARSFEFAAGLLGDADIRLGHDAAFLLAKDVRERYRDRVGVLPDQTGVLLRTDKERVTAGSGGIDIMAQASDDWCDLAHAQRVVEMAMGFILGFGRVRTDRLHCAILSAILGRKTILHPNSYFKNKAVFEQSLRRLANVEFEERDRAPSTGANDPVAFALEHAATG
jgi:exopolysaccharide biosynthesis predicted pyruvyltransferase EpsI